MIYLHDKNLMPLQVFLKQILTQASISADLMLDMTPEERRVLERQAEVASRMKYCVIVVSTIPMMIIYPFLQKYFEKGIMIGSVKG